nr:hypothetical protein [Shigella flexneri]
MGKTSHCRPYSTSASKLLQQKAKWVSGLIIAFQNRNFEAIKTYMEIIKNENITPEEIAEHLDKKNGSDFLVIMKNIKS